jgi:DNA repair protein RadC
MSARGAGYTSDLFGNVVDVTGDGRALAVCERPRERIRAAGAMGAAVLSDVEALAVVVQGVGEEQAGAAVALARAWVLHFGCLAAMAGRSVGDLMAAPGAGGCSEAAALRVVAALEISRRVMAARGEASDRLDRPEAIARFMEPRALGVEVEKFWVLVLDRKSRLRRCVELTSGIAHATICHPVEILRAVLREGGHAFAVVHNHPSGCPAPSSADIQVTRQIREAARAVDVSFVDHVVVGRAGADALGRGFYSFREAGLC